MLKKINVTVREIWGVLLVYGALIQLAGMWFVQDKAGYTIGLWIGIALAMFMIWHMYIGIDKALDLDAGGAQKKSILMFLIRFLVICAVIFSVFFFKIGNVILTFIGIFGLKIGAYVQPFVHMRRTKGRMKGE